MTVQNQPVRILIVDDEPPIRRFLRTSLDAQGYIVLEAEDGAGALDIDYQGSGLRSADVKVVHCSLRHEQVLRHSSRTGQTHPIGGFLGAVEYQGELSEFLPFLEAARWTGVGRQAVWGKGEIALTVL